MYGRLRKCPEQLEADRIFLHECDSLFKNREIASRYHVKRGWDNYYQQQLDVAMRRFNQAWLLDSTNADVYWGFGNLLGMKQDFHGSIRFFNTSLGLNPANPTVWACAAQSYSHVALRHQNALTMDTAITYYKRAIRLNPALATAYGELGAIYCHLAKKDSATKYYELAVNLDKKAVHPKLKKMIRRMP